MSLLKKFSNTLTLVAGWLAALSLLLLIVLALVQILARNLFDSGIAEADTLTRYLVLYVTFFGAAVAVQRGRHIRIDVLCALLQPAMVGKLYRPMHTGAAVICGLFTDAAIRFWRDGWQFAPQHEQWLSLVGLIIPVGFALLTVQFLLAAVLGPDDEAA